ncbi:MAG: T9SS type A sorting domain-containing protein [Bacteroidota bacterium]
MEAAKLREIRGYANGNPFTLSAKASSGLPVTFEIVAGPATVSDSTVTITGAGGVTVKALQKGNDIYNAAEAVQIFTIDLFTGLNDSMDAVIISPNPATNTLFIQAPSSFKSISLKDMLGRDAITKDITRGETTIDVGNLPRGLYIVRLKASDQSTVTRKIILR